jgi:glycolate oxidase FAD binding subunit
MSGLAGVVEHAAGDMTVAVRAGTTLADLQAALVREGQFLAIDPPVPGTVGGLIATGDSGPRRLRYGGVRDLILGVTFVRPDGTIARGGGKVVKNVAGYDLPKLLTGSLGTLGVIIEANFRLYPIPPSSATLALRVPIARASKWAASLAGDSLVPAAVDYFSGVVEGDEGAAARFETSPVSAQAQAERASALAASIGGAQGHILDPEDEEALWTEMDSVVVTGPDDVLARLITTVAELPLLAESAQRAAQDAAVSLTVRAHLRHGHALLRWRDPTADTAVHLLRQLRGEAEARASNLVVWRAPAEVRAEVDVWGNPGEGLGLMRRVKAQFDPNNMLNPGRFVGGI